MQAAKTRTEASFRWSCAFWEGSLHGMGLSGFRPPVTLQEFKDLCIRSYIGSEACDAGRGIGGRSHARTFSAGSITAETPIYGIRILPPDGGVLGIDPVTICAVPAP